MKSLECPQVVQDFDSKIYDFYIEFIESVKLGLNDESVNNMLERHGLKEFSLIEVSLYLSIKYRKLISLENMIKPKKVL